ncbi:MAG: tRNA-specific adenosine deaminase [Phycisphaera sp.]|nr:tRNA-specific adenosine deaminase [Phycisphaera sp.]
MRKALTMAQRAWDMGEVPIGAIVYRGDEVIAEAHNTRESDADPTGHAELLAIRAAARAIGDWRLNDCSLAVTLEPCPMCAGAIVNARVGRVIYGATDPKAGAVETLYRLCDDDRLNHRAVLLPGVMAEECGRMLRDFFEERRRAKRGD